jgi:phosphatidylinositol alpha-1,6-mannosyltransferase
MNDKITLLSYDYPPNDGGISRLAAAFADGLAKNGQNIEVCTLDDSLVKKGLARPEIPTIELPRKKLWREMALLQYLLKQPRNTKIITSVWNPEATLAWLLGRRNLYVLAHGNEVLAYPSGAGFRVKNWLRKKVLCSARNVICNSRYTETLVRELAPEATTTIINPGVDTARFDVSLTQYEARFRLSLPTDKKLLLSVSRVDEYKGHDVVLQSLALLTTEQRKKLHYVVAGKGSHLEVLKREATKLGLDEHITWLGFVADESLPILYKAADLFVLCTREDKKQRGVEGFGMVFLEAQASGLAVVGTRAGGIPDAIKAEYGGWLIEQDDQVALKCHLENLIENPDAIANQGLKGLKRVQSECTWQHYTNQLLTVLEAK